jgi:hypothetical protein
MKLRNTTIGEMTMSTTARHFIMNSTDSNERSHAAMGRPVLACQWKLNSEGQLTGRWLCDPGAPDAEHCAWMSVHPSADGSQDAVHRPRRLQTVVSRIVMGVFLAISVCGTLVCFTTEPSGLF